MNIPFLKIDRDPATGKRTDPAQVAGDPHALDATHEVIHLNAGTPKAVYVAYPKYQPPAVCPQPPGEKAQTYDAALAPSWCVGHLCPGRPAYKS